MIPTKNETMRDQLPKSRIVVEGKRYVYPYNISDSVSEVEPSTNRFFHNTWKKLHFCQLLELQVYNFF